MLKLSRVTKVKVLFLVLVFVFNFELFKFSAAILEKGLLNNTELFLKLFHIQSKEIGNNKCYKETTELEKWQSEISPEYWR